MKSLIFILCFCVLSYGLLTILPNKNAQSFYVDYVIDGDTFVAEGKAIRIWGIDTPEKTEPFYETAKITLENLIQDQFLNCNFIALGKYRRDVMRCYLKDDDIAGIMVRQGFAKDNKSFLGGYYTKEEAMAQKENLGIWAR